MACNHKKRKKLLSLSRGREKSIFIDNWEVWYCPGCNKAKIDYWSLYTNHDGEWVDAKLEKEVIQFISSRAASIALMFANVHLCDRDCLGNAARELYDELKDVCDPYKGDYN